MDCSVHTRPFQQPQPKEPSSTRECSSCRVNIVSASSSSNICRECMSRPSISSISVPVSAPVPAPTSPVHVLEAAFDALEPLTPPSSEDLLEAATLLFLDVDQGHILFGGHNFYRIDFTKTALSRKSRHSKKMFIDIDGQYSNIRKHNSVDVVCFPKSKTFCFNFCYYFSC